MECSQCSVNVHPRCYGLSKQIIKSGWRCDKCAFGNDFVGCSLCFGLFGAFKQTELLKSGEFDESDFIPNSGWVHLICAQVIPGLKLRNNTTLYPIYGVELLDKRFFDKRLICCFCTKTIGVIQCCDYSNCEILFHPRCALNNGCLITITSFNKSSAFCKNHSIPSINKGKKFNITRISNPSSPEINPHIIRSSSPPSSIIIDPIYKISGDNPLNLPNKVVDELSKSNKLNLGIFFLNRF